MQACVHAGYVFACRGPYISQIWLDQRDQSIYGIRRKMKVSIESGEHTGPIWVHNMTQAHKLACMHIIFLLAQTQISAKFCHSSKIKISMESQDYFPHVRTYASSCEGARGSEHESAARLWSWQHIGYSYLNLIYIMLVLIYWSISLSVIKLKS